jgi:mono/diheme cytochrome c family protein
MRARHLALSAIIAATLAQPAVAENRAAQVKRGAYLANGAMACANCHTPRAADMSPRADMAYAGGFNITSPAFDVFTANITPDKETGIGSWTDAEIITALREGKSRDGHIIFPPMPVPTYNAMSDADVKAIVAYLRTIKPIHNAVPRSKYNIPQQPMPPAKGVKAPPASDKVAYGGYIVNALAHCFECHTAPDAHGVPDMRHGMGAGGFDLPAGPGMTIRTPNITPDKDTGIGKWSDDDIRKAITLGVRPDGRHLAPPMAYPFYKTMTRADLDAVIAYLRSIPPIHNDVLRVDAPKQPGR